MLVEYLAVTAVVAVVLRLWAGWLKKKPEFPKGLSLLPALPGAVWALSAAVSLIFYYRAFQATSEASAQRKAEALSEGIASMMHAAIIGAIALGLMVLYWAYLTWKTLKK